MVIGSRFVAGGDVGEFAANRVKISKLGAQLARLVVKQDLSDPMSGFFMLRREVFERVVRRLSAKGFKILLDIFASSPKPLKMVELPFTFGSRIKGESKLDTMVAWEYAHAAAGQDAGQLRTGPLPDVHGASARWASASISRSCGSPIDARAVVRATQTIATLIAMVFNYWLNNIITYRDQQLKGMRFVYWLFQFRGDLQHRRAQQYRGRLLSFRRGSNPGVWRASSAW